MIVGKHIATLGFAFGVLVAGAGNLAAQAVVAGPGGTQFDVQLLRAAGGPVVPFFEGWYQNPDGTYELVFGYLNTNTEEVLEIPLGERNMIEPGTFQGVQPTRFDPIPEGDRRHWGVFTITVPENWGDRDVVWTVRSHEQALSVPGRLTRAPYELDGWKQPGRLTVAPWLRFESGPPIIGPAGGLIGPYAGHVGEPVTISFVTGRDNPYDLEDVRPVQLRWTKHQGAGGVRFHEQALEAKFEGGDGVAVSTSVVFDAPGDYVLRVLAYNTVTDFEFFCCWTNASVLVRVMD